METNKVAIGATISDIKTTDARGNAFKLSNLKKSYALVAFLRYAGCPFCNLSVHRLAMEHSLLLDSNCDIVAFIQSDTKEIDKNIYKRHAVTPKFNILPDNDMKYYKRFGVKPSYKYSAKFIKDIPHWVHAVRHHGFAQGKVDGSLFIAPAMFIIHIPSMKVIHADYASDLFEHETFSPVYEKILTHSL
jgi:peroxiredoxin Q/BCP